MLAFILDGLGGGQGGAPHRSKEKEVSGPLRLRGIAVRGPVFLVQPDPAGATAGGKELLWGVPNYKV